MIKNKGAYVACIIIFSLIFAVSLFGCAQKTQNLVIQKPVTFARTQNVTVQKPVVIDRTEFTKQTVKKEIKITKVDREEDDYNEENTVLDSESNSELSKESQVSEGKREIMQNALELLEEADKLWKNDDMEETLDTLDETYSLILDANGDPIIVQEKDNLRLLIAQRILAVYSSKRTVLNGKNSEIPLTMNADVEKEIRSFQGVERDSFIAAYQRSGMYSSAILKELKKAGIPEEFFWLPLIESLFKINAYSSARALGLWQFIPSTGYKFGLIRNAWIDERMDVQKSTRAAIAYLKELHNMFGDWLTVLAAYNCGEGRVLRVISRQHINYLDSFWDLYRQLPNETARYVPRFLAILHIIKDPQKYGFDLSDPEEPISTETVKVNKIMKLKDIADKIGASDETMALLNPELKYKMTPDHEYDLRIPEQSLEKFKLVYNDIPESQKPRLVSARKVFIKHRVRRGETLSSIARKYHVSISTIKFYNKLRSNKLIKGRRLTIPTSKRGYARVNIKRKSVSSPGRYKVRKGDTLSIIASRYGMTLNKIRKLNDLKTNKIYVGQRLKVIKKR
ncbi:MAG: LysM peptidoglycan-binding domain-containing protein [Bacteroidota bacterium]|nr:LysM peptidoglycan-binding domain-containing protein [Bacteroidota bacterium]